MKIKLLNVLCLASLISLPAVAAIVEMPDTEDEPEAERKPMLESPDAPEEKPDFMAGPHLNIREIRIQGVEEYPDFGVTLETLNKRIETIRFVSDDQVEWIAEKELTPELIVRPSEERKNQGITVGMILIVADTVTRYYRERGFILAKAYVPQQRVQDGVVVLTLLPGNLGEIELLNSKKYRAKTVEAIFAPIVDKPVTAKNIEQHLYLVNELPGLSVQGYFEPGSEVGDTRLNINVLQEKSFAGHARIDNHGSESTGEYRLYTDGYWYNPGGFGDQLHIGILGTFEPSNSLYGSLHYGLPLFSPRTRLTIGGSTNDFVSDSLSGITLTGRSVIYDASLRHIFNRSRLKSLAGELRLSEVASDIKDKERLLPLEEDELDDTVRNLDVVLSFDGLLERGRALHQGDIQLTYGDFVKGRGIYQDKNPLSVSFNYWLIKYVKTPFVNANSRIQLRFAGQYTETSLPSTSQFTLTGPNKLRAFHVNQSIADRGAYLAADWIFEIPGQGRLAKTLQPYIFWEMGYGDTKDAGHLAARQTVFDTPEQPGSWALMSDVGLGLRFNVGKSIRANVHYAYATSYEADFGPYPRENLRALEDRDKVYFDLLYSF